eukprot:6211944-Pleurochrysis_carterae.AAC.3
MGVLISQGRRLLTCLAAAAWTCKQSTQTPLLSHVVLMRVEAVSDNHSADNDHSNESKATQTSRRGEHAEMRAEGKRQHSGGGRLKPEAAQTSRRDHELSRRAPSRRSRFHPPAARATALRLRPCAPAAAVPLAPSRRASSQRRPAHTQPRTSENVA